MSVARPPLSPLTLSWAAEYADARVASNCLWPETFISMAAVQTLLGGAAAIEKSRTPRIVGEAAAEILSKPSREVTRQHLHRCRRASPRLPTSPRSVAPEAGVRHLLRPTPVRQRPGPMYRVWIAEQESGKCGIRCLNSGRVRGREDR